MAKMASGPSTLEMLDSAKRIWYAPDMARYASELLSEVGKSAGGGKLGGRLFREIEAAQGFAFISDSVAGMSDEGVIAIAMGALVSARKVVKILERYAGVLS